MWTQYTALTAELLKYNSSMRPDSFCIINNNSYYGSNSLHRRRRVQIIKPYWSGGAYV